MTSDTTLALKRLHAVAEFATIAGISAPMLATRGNGDAGSVDASAIPDDLMARAQPSQVGLLDALSH